jgi:hypothetical protein
LWIVGVRFSFPEIRVGEGRGSPERSPRETRLDGEYRRCDATIQEIL